MNKSPTLSVVVPMYNETGIIEECLAKLLAQAHPITEIIVVNNASTDGCDKVVAKDFPSVTLLHEPKQGIVFARNRGFDHARTDIIAKIDADSYADPDWSSSILADFDRYACDAWTGEVKGNQLNPYFAKITEKAFNFFTFTFNGFVSGHTPLFGSNLAMKKIIWHQIKDSLNMKNDIWEDLDMSLAIGEKDLIAYTQRLRNISILSRSANTSLTRFVRRMYGQSRVYQLRGYKKSYFFSLIFVLFATLVWASLRPFSFIGESLTKRPRPDQY